jgi:hypothetical protein
MMLFQRQLKMLRSIPLKLYSIGSELYIEFFTVSFCVLYYFCNFLSDFDTQNDFCENKFSKNIL